MTSPDAGLAGACGDTAPAGALAPGSPEWTRTITASKVPAILGLSRFQSQYALWHEMAGLVEPAPITESRQELFDYGHAVEHAAAAFWRYRNPGWRLSPGEVAFTDPELPFPNQVTVDRRASRGRSRRIVEVKSARSLEEWGDDGTGETPSDYAAQIVMQQHVSGLTADADLVLWPTFGYPRIYTVAYDRDVAELIVARCAEWWESIQAGTPPELDDTVATYECLKRLHPDIERGAEVQVPRDLALAYLDTVEDRKALDKTERGYKSQLLDLMGDAEIARTDGGLVVAKRTNGPRDSVVLRATPKTLTELKEQAA